MNPEECGRRKAATFVFWDRSSSAPGIHARAQAVHTGNRMAVDSCSPKNVTKVLEKLKYKVSGRQGVRRSTVKAKGVGTTRTGEKVRHTLVLELMRDTDGLWKPLPDEGTVSSWDLSRSYLVSFTEEEKCTTRKLVKSREDVEYVLAKMGTQPDPGMFD